MARILQNAKVGSIPVAEKMEPKQDSAQIDLELIKREAFASGKKSGYEQGFKEGQISGATTLEQELSEEMSYFKDKAKTLLQNIQQEICHSKTLQPQEIAGIVLHIISQLFLQRQVKDVWVLEQVNQVLLTLSHEQQVTLYIHPQDIQRMKQQQISLNATHLGGLKICADEGLSLGGARIKTNYGEFDLSVERQIARLKQLLSEIQEGTIHG